MKKAAAIKNPVEGTIELNKINKAFRELSEALTDLQSNLICFAKYINEIANDCGIEGR